MRGKVVFLVVILSSLLVGCTGPWLAQPREEGVIHIVVNPRVTLSSSMAPKAIPDIATKVRIRVWHPDTGFNALTTVALNGEGGVDIPVPEDTGYIVDAVSYYLKHYRAMALTGGRAHNVDVAAKQTTTVQVGLRPWETEAAGDTTAEPGEHYTVEFVPTDGGGLLTLQTFKGATLRTSTTSFQNPNVSLPLYPGTQGLLFDDRIAFTASAPEVTEITTLYVCSLVEFAQPWKDTTIADRNEQPLYIEFPNRHMEEALHEVTIDPTAGGLIVEISGLK
jgi:hypothetical protein